MADTLHLEIATPERLLVKEDATEVYVPAANGMIGILPEHAPLLSEVGVGELAFVTREGRRTVFVAGGWVQILNNDVRVRADRAEDIGEIDTARAEPALTRAQERLNAPATAG
ncbi:MAG TPA: ATP synthase F1 subunit epsilon, partial [Bryobacteraceae bacterium]|nr:ATP synthase F1 subunit epsilon [Bryobacteraceae bacterium]